MTHSADIIHVFCYLNHSQTICMCSQGPRVSIVFQDGRDKNNEQRTWKAQYVGICGCIVVEGGVCIFVFVKVGLNE